MPFSRRGAILRTSIAAWSSSLRGVGRGLLAALPFSGRAGRGAQAKGDSVTSEQVERAIRAGVSFLKSRQLGDGSWSDPKNHHQHIAGTCSLIVHALLIAGVKRDDPQIVSALKFLEKFSPGEIDGSYSVALQTIVFAETDPERYRVRITANVDWLERAQVKPGDAESPGWPGTCAHSSDKRRPGDNSSTQFALLGLNAAAEVGVPVKTEVWVRARAQLERSQRRDGSWSYYFTPSSNSTGSMTCAGISGLTITRRRLGLDQERFVGDAIEGCGKAKDDPRVRRGLEWLGRGFSVSQNPGALLRTLWKHYYLYGTERVGRFLGQRFIGGHDWYREGAEELVASQDVLLGSWTGIAVETAPLIATSFAVLFLATGRSPLLVNKVMHGPGDDWNNDPDDVRNLTGLISDDWKHLLTWQVVDLDQARVEDLLLAPIVYFNGHEAPVFSATAKEALRSYVDQGGFILAEACCGRKEFDRGFRALVKELFPEEGYELKLLPEGHGVYQAHHKLSPAIHPLWGVERGCRTSVVYSPGDLSCYWNQMEAQPEHPLVWKARHVGQNIVDYATGRNIPADKLAVREARPFPVDSPRRGVLRIAKLRHRGGWNVAPLAIPNLAAALRRPPLNLDAALDHYELDPEDPNLIYYPLVYIHGRSAMAFDERQIAALRAHVDPGGGTFFADAACGSAAFDASFRKLADALFPGNPLTPIPREDDLYSAKVGFDLSDSLHNKAAGGGRDYPRLEGIKINGVWGVIYSRYDIGCALEGHSGSGCKGFTYESALKIAANVVLYATMP